MQITRINFDVHIKEATVRRRILVFTRRVLVRTADPSSSSVAIQSVHCPVVPLDYNVCIGSRFRSKKVVEKPKWTLVWDGGHEVHRFRMEAVCSSLADDDTAGAAFLHLSVRSPVCVCVCVSVLAFDRVLSKRALPDKFACFI